MTWACQGVGGRGGEGPNVDDMFYFLGTHLQAKPLKGGSVWAQSLTFWQCPTQLTAGPTSMSMKVHMKRGFFLGGFHQEMQGGFMSNYIRGCSAF